jgi:hypothetical protein
MAPSPIIHQSHNHKSNQQHCMHILFYMHHQLQAQQEHSQPCPVQLPPAVLLSVDGPGLQQNRLGITLLTALGDLAGAAQQGSIHELNWDEQHHGHGTMTNKLSQRIGSASPEMFSNQMLRMFAGMQLQDEGRSCAVDTLIRTDRLLHWKNRTLAARQ